jgi:hypothetical protein
MDIATKRLRVVMDPLLYPWVTTMPGVHRSLSPPEFELHPPNPHAIPLTLLHPIFSRFVGNAETHRPTREDYAVIQELRSALSQTWEEEATTGDAIRFILSQHYGIQLYPAFVGATARQTGGNTTYKSYMLVVLEVKSFNGEGGQGTMYVSEAIRPIPEQKQDPFDVLPCIVIRVAGRCSFFIPYYPILTLGGSSQGQS